MHFWCLKTAWKIYHIISFNGVFWQSSMLFCLLAFGLAVVTSFIYFSCSLIVVNILHYTVYYYLFQCIGYVSGSFQSLLVTYWLFVNTLFALCLAQSLSQTALNVCSVVKLFEIFSIFKCWRSIGWENRTVLFYFFDGCNVTYDPYFSFHENNLMLDSV